LVGLACLSFLQAGPISDALAEPENNQSLPQELCKEQKWQEGRACGCNTLYCLLQIHGCPVVWEDLLAYLVPPELGNSMEELRRAAAHWGLHTRVMKTDRRGIHELTLPFIAHLETPGALDHYVLVIGVDEASVRVIDGTTTLVQSLPFDVFCREWTGYALTTGPDRLTKCFSMILVAELLFLAWFLSKRAKNRFPRMGFALGIVGGCFIYYAYSSVRPSKPVVNGWRSEPVDLQPLGGLEGTVPKQELAKVLVYLKPRWQSLKTNNLLHALRLWGRNARFESNDPLGSYPESFLSGNDMVRLLLDDKHYHELGVLPGSFLFRSREGVSVRYGEPTGNVAHCDQLLKVMGEIGLPSGTQINLHDGDKATLNDVIRASLAEFSIDHELEFTTIAYCRWLPPRKEWVDRNGQRYTFNALCQKILDQPVGKGACCGTHALYALVTMLRVDEIYDILSDKNRNRIRTRLRDVCHILETNQSTEGAWFEGWPGRNQPGADNETFQAIWVTGHQLEWIALAPRDLRPKRESISKAAQLLARIIPQHVVGTIENNYDAFSHAARALVLMERIDPIATQAGMIAQGDDRPGSRARTN
jgi:hypothetical protein